MHEPSRRGDARGQAAIEAALVLPILIIAILAIVQLTALAQAKLMTFYAAYQAARAGIVWNGNRDRMRDAALLTLLPTIGRTDGQAQLGDRLTFAEQRDDRFRRKGLFGLLKVTTLNPRASDGLSAIWNLRGGSLWQELDFDGPGTYPEHPDLDAHLADQSSQAKYRAATELSIRLDYLYELSIPIANRLVFEAWRLAQGAGRNELDPSLLAALGAFAQREGRYLFPLQATHRMRMQSSFYRKWLDE